MNYKNLYDKIIVNRQANPITDGYTERHHIVPRSLGGSDESDNLVALTVREHFICHYLLSKMYAKETIEWYKMNHALMAMKAGSVTGNRYFNSRLYESLKGNWSMVMSYAQRGERNSQYGTRWIHSLEEKRSTRIGKLDPLPDGWNEGRVLNFMRLVAKNERKDKISKKKIESRRRALELFERYIASDARSVKEFCDKGYYEKSHVSLHYLWKRYVPDFENISSQGKSIKGS